MYLHSVNLSGYKTIKSVGIDFEEDLTIIIGKNGVGKTNFLTFLDRSLSFDYKNLYEAKTKLVFENGERVEIITESYISTDSFNKSNPKEILPSPDIKYNLSIAGKPIKLEGNDIELTLISNKIGFENTLIPHRIPLTEFNIVDKPLNFVIEKDVPNLFNIIEAKETPVFLRSLLLNLFISFIGEHKPEEINLIRERTLKSLEEFYVIKPFLKEYTPIEDIKYNDNINIFFDKEKNTTIINNIFLEFKIGGTWHPFSNLSDGTKRMFYIIAEVAFVPSFYLNDETLNENRNKIKRIVLIEEPELGVHPQQLFKIMQFLKRLSVNNQIIISTHSPQILDDIISDPKELKKIIIAYDEKNNGTQLRHLDDKEIAKAEQYMLDSYLSDYWLRSDMEDFKHYNLLLP